MCHSSFIELKRVLRYASRRAKSACWSTIVIGVRCTIISFSKMESRKKAAGKAKARQEAEAEAESKDREMEMIIR